MRLFNASRISRSFLLGFACWLASSQLFLAQRKAGRILSGVIVTQKNEAVEGVSLTIVSSSGEKQIKSDPDGAFRSEIPDEPVTLKIRGKYLAPREMQLGLGDRTRNLKITVEFVIPPIHESLVINATVLEPSIDRRDDVVYKSTLFSRDDQIFQTLDAGISLGQHEGGQVSGGSPIWVQHGSWGSQWWAESIGGQCPAKPGDSRARTRVFGTTEVSDARVG